MIEISKSDKYTKGLPKSYYVSAHLLKAMNLLNRVLEKKGQLYWEFSASQFTQFSKEDLAFIDGNVKVLSIRRQDSEQKWHNCTKSKLFDLTAYEAISSGLKRRALTKNGDQRYLDACICYWLYRCSEFLPFEDKTDDKGQSYRLLLLSDTQSPITHSIWFSVEGNRFRILMRGNGQAIQKHKKRATGRTQEEEVGKETKSSSAVENKPTQQQRKVTALSALVQEVAAVSAESPDGSDRSSGPEF